MLDESRGTRGLSRETKKSNGSGRQESKSRREDGGKEDGRAFVSQATNTVESNSAHMSE